MNVTAVHIRQALLELLADPDNRFGGNLLGSYIYESGLVDHALAIGNPPNGIEIDGLECLLPLFPDTKNEWTTAFVHSEETWDITLVQREIPEGQSPTLCAAVDRLRRFFAISEGRYFPQDDVLGSYPQYSFTFRRSDLHPIINKVAQICA